MALMILLPVYSDESMDDGISYLKKTGKAFSNVAKAATPAVVSIEVTIKKERDSQVPGHPFEDDPSDFFNDDFFRHFFGIPRPDGRGKTPSQPKQSKKDMGRGSGLIVTKEGHILTNSHVVHEADKITVLLNDGREFEAKLVGSDPGTDVAVIKVETEDLPYLEFGDSDALDVGEWVIAIGNPLGLQASVTVGVVSAKGRNNLHITDFGDLIQTDAAINPGNSGGPLLDLDGKVVGLNTAIVSTSGGYMGIGFAIPSLMVKHVMDQLIETGAVTRGFLGIAPQDLTRELAEAFKMESSEGVLVADVVPDSPAEEAGIMRGDIIKEINGVEVSSSVEVSKEIGLMTPNSKALIALIRKGEPLTLKVLIGVHPKNRFQLDSLSEKLGLEVEALTTDYIEKYNYHNQKGVIVTKVVPSLPADAAGIRPGNLILAVDRIEVNNLAEYYDAIKEAVLKQRVLLLVKQGKVNRFINLKLE